MATGVTLKKVRLSVSNAVHSLAVLVARDEGLFRDQGLDVEIVRTPGSAHVDTDRQAVRDAIFERPLETLYNTGEMDQFRLCEWGVMKRAVDGELCGQRPPRSSPWAQRCPSLPSWHPLIAASSSRNSSRILQWR